jgi:hypothetical protein
MEFIPYKYLYYAIIPYAFFFVIFLEKYKNRLSKGLIATIIFPVIIVYILGMARSRGTDLGVYINNFYSAHHDGMLDGIQDLGYVMFSDILYWLGMPFQSLTVIFGIVTIISIFRMSKFYSIDFLPLFFIYLIHLIVVTDFAQLRIGMAMSLAIIAFISTSRYRFIVYIISFSAHFSVLFFILISEYVKFVSNIRSNLVRIICIFLLISLLFLTGKYLYLLTFVDPRVGVYLSYPKYGSPVSHYYQPLFHFLILIPFLLFRVNKNRKIFVLLTLEIIGIATFFAFSNYAIFAFRLSNTLLFFYPVLIFYLFNLMATRFCFLKKNRHLFFTILISTFMVILLLRPGSYKILNTIML